MEDASSEYTNEIWKPVIGWEELYEVSNYGRIKSLERKITTSDNKQMTRRERILSIKCNSAGYPVVTFNAPGRQKTVYIHQEVLKSFVGPCPDGMIASCIGDKDDVRLSMLKYQTLKQKLRSRTDKQHGKRDFPISDEILIQMRELHKSGLSIAEIARRTGISYRYTFRLIKEQVRKPQTIDTSKIVAHNIALWNQDTQ